MSNKFYITTTLAYVNASPHIGFAAEIIKADCIARWYRLNGDEVFFNTGTDEHGLKIYERALEKGLTVQEFVDQGFVTFQEQLRIFGVSEDYKPDFIYWDKNSKVKE